MANLAERCREFAASAMKDGIGQAALDVLQERGYDALTIDRVADRAGISKGCVYNYFRNKQELITYVFERIIAPAEEEAKQILARACGAMEKLESLVRMWFEYFSRHRGLFDFLFRDTAVRQLCYDSQRQKDSQALDDFSLILEQGIREGVFRPHDCRGVAELMIGAIQFVIERQMELAEQRPAEQEAQRILDVFMRGVTADPKNPMQSQRVEMQLQQDGANVERVGAEVRK